MVKEKTKDIIYSASKALVGSIPFAGAIASEILQLIVSSPLEKRRDVWMKDVGERLLELEKDQKIDFTQLQQNEQFIDIVIQATNNALKTSNQEKLEYYKNILINSALSNSPDESEIQMIINLIDSFTAWHIKILKLFDNPEDWYNKNNKPIPSYMMASMSTVLEEAYPELKGRREFYNLIWSDLERAGLHNSGSLQTMMSGSGILEKRTTEFGKRFLAFIMNK